MNDLESFLSMGGYAGFVWPAYGLVLVVVLALVLVALRRLRRAEAELRELRGEARDDRADEEA